MAQNIEIPVSLGLQNAQQQVATLREMLNKSVKVDSSAFKDIERFLNRIVTQADSLQGKMGEAFKTSSGSKAFLKQYEQLIGMLESAQGKFTSLGLNDIAFSAEDQRQVDDAIDKIKQLQSEIANLEKGKIGNLFDNSSLEGADKVQAFIEQLKSSGQDVGKLTFSGLSAAVAKELKGVQDSIHTTEERITSLKSQITSLSGNELDNLTTKMQEAITGATDNSKSTFKVENILEYRKALEEFYQTYELYTGGRNTKNDTQGSVSTWIKNESQRVADGIAQMKEKFQEYQKALAELERIRSDSSITRTTARQQVQNVADLLGISFDANSADYKSYISSLVALRERIKEEFEGFNNTQDIENYGKQMLESLSHIFDNADLNKVVNVANLRKQLESIFKELNVNVNDSDITRILNSFTQNIDTSTFLEGAKQALESYRQKQEETVNSAVENNNKLKESEADLKQVQEVTNKQDVIRTDGIKEKQADIESLRNLLQSLIDKVNQANGTNLKLVDNNNINTGKASIESYIQSLTKLEKKQKTLSNVQMAVNRWMGFWQVLNMTKSAIKDMKSHIEELDQVMTKIAVVTNFSQSDLWGQIGTYSEIARQYGVAIKGVYEVSQIYYQQGLQQNDVMTLTTETLKMARIAGLDYATAADYMTTAIRGFKMEMSDAAHVTDVFSALAATTASSTEEIAVAISKTAASAANVGSSFEATSAMMATMIATTRESATNIGTALKSIISRYGEMKENMTGTDAEGEEYSLNKVDKALQTIGVSIHTATGEFRDFDDVIMELAEKWDTLDSVSQRYIATVMAGNRQQSRFLALVSNVDQYKKALETAMTSEGAGELQTLKTLDSIDAKLEKMKVTIQEFYTSSGIEDLYKGILDTITNVISAANSLPKVFDKIPIQALAIGASITNIVKTSLTLLINSVQAGLNTVKGNTGSFLEGIITMWRQAGQRSTQAYNEEIDRGTSAYIERHESKLSQRANQVNQSRGASSGVQLLSRYGGMIASVIGSLLTISGMNSYGSSTSVGQDQSAGITTLGGGLLSAAGSAMTGFAVGGPVGAIAGAVSGIAMNMGSIISGIDMLNVTTARRVELAEKDASEKKTEAAKQQGEVQNLEKALNTYKELQEASYSSTEAMQAFKDNMNQLADSYPGLISQMDEQGNYIIELESLEAALAAAREKSAIATANATQAELQSKQEQRRAFQSTINSFSNLSNIDSDEAYQLGSRITQNNLKKLLPGVSWEKYGSTFEEQIENVYNRIMPDNQLSDFSWNNVDQRAQVTSAFSNISTLYSNLKKQVDILQTVDSSLSTEFLTGFDNIQHLDTFQIISAVNRLQSVSQDYITSYTNTINNTSEILTRQMVDSQLLQLQNNPEGIYDFDYDKHSSLVKTLVGSSKTLQLLGQADNENSELYEDAVKRETLAYVEFFEANQTAATWLENLDFDKITSYQELQSLLQKNIYDENSLLDEIIRQYYLEQYEKYTSQSNKAFNEALAFSFTKTESGKTTKLIESSLYNKLASLSDESDYLHQDPIALITPLLNQVQLLLPNYAKMLENTPTLAENYLTGLVNVFREIGTLDGSLQDSISSIIIDIDFSDEDSIQTAIDALSSQGEEYKPVIEQLQSAQQMLVKNVKMQAITVQQGLVDYAKSVEKIFTNSTKEFTYSEALSTALEILESNNDLTLDQLITSTDSGKFVLTKDAISAQLSSVTDKEKEILIALQTKTENKIKLYKDILDAPMDELTEIISTSTSIDEDGLEIEHITYGEISYNKLQTYVASNYSGEELIKAQDELDQIYSEWQSQDAATRGTFLSYLTNEITSLQSIVDDTIEIGKHLTAKVAQYYLQSFDYKSIARGTATEVDKSNLETILRSATDVEFASSTFEHYYQELLKGNFDSWNQWLTNYLQLGNFTIGDTQKFEGLQADLEQYQQALDDILTEGVNFNVLSDATKEVLEKGGISSAEDFADFDKLKQARTFIISAILSSVVATAEEQSNTIKKSLEQQQKEAGYGKQKELLSAYKDGFSIDEALSLGLANTEGLLADFQSVLEEDTLNGGYKIKAGQNIASVLKYLADKLSITIDTESEEWKSMIDESITDAINQQNKTDIGKQATTALQSLISGKLGDRIDVSKIAEIAGNIYEITSEYERDQLLMSLNPEAYDEEYKKALKDVQNSITTKRNQAIQSVLSGTFDKATAETFISTFGIDPGSLTNIIDFMKTFGFEWDGYLQQFKATARSLSILRSRIAEAKEEGASIETLNQLEAQLDQIENQDQIDTSAAYSTFVQNYQALGTDAIVNFANTLGKSYEEVISQYSLELNGDGTYKVDLSTLQGIISQGQEAVGEATYNVMLETVAGIQDNILSSITGAAGFVYQGTNNTADMQKFVNEFNTLTGSNLGIEDAFSYDTILNTFTLNATTMKRYADVQKAELKKLGLSGEAIDEYIKDQTTTLIQQNMDIEAFLSAEGTTAKSREGNKLAQQIMDWMRADGAKLTDEALESMADSWIKQLNQGGQVAVDAIKAIKGTEATTAELEAAFNNSSIVKLRTAATELTKGVGETVSGYTKNIMAAAGFGLAELDDGSAVITSVGDMTQAYANLYAAMKANNDSITADLNSAYAQFLTAADQKNIDTLDVLENANGMAYDAFADLLTKYGKDFEQTLKYTFVESTGFGKVRITDFDRFAKYMNFDINSPEYAEAYNSWVDSMIELQDQPKQIMQNAADQIKNIANAKGGDNINVSYIAKELQWNDLDTALQAKLKEYGASFRNGILHLSEGANIAGLVTSITNEAAAAGQLIPEQLAELADTVEKMLSSITNLLSSGISGKLSNEQAQELQSWAGQKGIQLDFSRTADGLRISNEEAYKLYKVINEIDAVQGQVAFKSLKDNLIDTDDRFKSVSSTASYIEKIEKELSTLRSQEETPDNSARIAALEEELSLATEINAIRATSKDDSANFMSNSIPDAQNNPINYYENWAKALSAVKTAKSESVKDSKGKTHTGLIEYQDFYNIVTELNNIAGMTEQGITIGSKIEGNAVTLDGSLEKASQLIEKGAAALVATDTGEIKVSLGDIGIDFSDGSNTMADNVDAGIKAMAQSQMDMLDGLIQLLETIVQMQALGDIDTDSNGIDLSDIFDITYDKNHQIESINGFTQEYSDWQAEIIKKLDKKNTEFYDEDLANAMSSITIDGNKLSDMVQWDYTKFDASTAQTFSSTMAALYKAAISDNYDVNNIAESVQSELAAAGVFDQPITIDVGTKSLIFTGTTHASIDWADKDIQNIITNTKQSKEQLIDTYKKYLEGTENLSLEEFTTVLGLKEKIKIKKLGNGTTEIEVDDGNGGTKTLTEGTDEFGQTLGTMALDDAGFSGQKYHTKGGTVWTEVEYKNGVKVKVTGDASGIHWHSDITGKDYASESAMWDAEYDYYLKQLDTISGGNTDDKEALTKEQWIYQKYHVAVKTTAEWADGVDPSTDPDLRAEIIDKTSNGLKGVADFLEQNPNLLTNNQDGTFTIKLNGKDFTFASEGGTDLAKDLYSELMASLGLDSVLVDSITKGINQAFTGENGTAITTAITNGIKAAFGGTQEGDLAEGTTIPIPELKLAPEKITLSTGGEEAQGINIGDIITATVSTLKLVKGENFSQDSSEITVENLPDTIVKAVITTLQLIKGPGYKQEGITVEKLHESAASVDITTLELSKGSEFQQLPGDVSVSDLSVDEIKAIIAQIILTGTPTQDNNGMAPKDLENQIIEAIITSLTLSGTPEQTNPNNIGPKPLTNISLQAFITQLLLIKSYTDQIAGAVKPENLTKQSILAYIDSLTLSKSYENQELGDVAVEDLKDLSIQALITTLTLSKQYEQQSPGDVEVEDLKNKVLNALISKLQLQWAESGADHTPDPSVLNLPDTFESPDTKTYYQKVKVKYNIENDENLPDIIDARSKLNFLDLQYASTDYMNNLLGDYGLHNTEIAENSALQEYINSLEGIVNAGQELGSVDFSNIQKLMSLSLEGDVADQLQHIYDAAITNGQDAEDSLSSFKTLIESGMDSSNLSAVAAALSSIATSAQTLAGIAWKTISDGIASLNTASTKEGEGEDAEGSEIEIKLKLNTEGVTEALKQLKTDAESAANDTGSSYTSTMASAIESGEDKIINATGSIRTHFDELTTDINQKIEDVKSALASIQQHISITWDIVLIDPTTGNAATLQDKGGYKVDVDTNTDTSEVTESVEGTDATAPVGTKTDTSEVVKKITTLVLPTVEVNVKGIYTETTGVPSYITIPAKYKIEGESPAIGNFGLARAAGTLMGELGPELVVSNGRYFVAGQNGPEFVSLADDAIVFNHLQTEQLLKNGMSSERGRAVTNERVATAYAKGNINGGPAMASASAALAALKQLRSQWASLAQLSAKDLAGTGGSGGGGGGGDNGAFTKELERWYNWLQKIAELEEKINYQEKVRSTISSAQRKNGKSYYRSQKESLKDLQEQVKTEQSLIDAQEKYFEQRRKELNESNGPFNSLYTFDENGQLKYKDGMFEKLSKISGVNEQGKPNYTAEEQYKELIKMNPKFAEYMKYNSSGEEIEAGDYASMVQAFWDKIDTDKEEMQSLHDSINEHKDALMEAQQAQNELLQEIRDNQMTVEQNVYDAIVDSRERAIEDAENMRDAIEDSANKFVDGLQNALDKERQMYETEEAENDLDKKRRRLAILQRTGGSGSEIASLQSEIQSSERDLYFDKQQEQIDAIQEASDKQIEKLDQQIELDQELLDYQKAHGLLWGEVANIMKQDSQTITDFITNNNSEWWAKSPLATQQDLEQALFEATQWVEFRDDQDKYFQEIVDAIYASTNTAAGNEGANNDDGYDGTEGTTKADKKSKYKVTYKDENGKEQTRYFRTKEEAETFKSKHSGAKMKEAKYKVFAKTAGSNPKTKTWGPYMTKKIAQAQMEKLREQDKKRDTPKYSTKDKDWGVGTDKKKPSGFATGGMNTVPGLYELHGTKTKPEAVLNAKQTKILRDNILSNKPTSLISLLSDFQTGMNRATNNYSTIDRSSGTDIGSISLNMDVKQIANDYDAKRAGEKAMEEMLRIARKSTTATIRR